MNLFSLIVLALALKIYPLVMVYDDSLPIKMCVSENPVPRKLTKKLQGNLIRSMSFEPFFVVPP